MKFIRSIALALLAAVAFNVHADTVQIGDNSGRILKLSNGGIPVDKMSLDAGDDQSLNRKATYVSGAPKNLTASGQVAAKAGVLNGVWVSASTSCTIKLWDSTTGSGTVLIPTTAAVTAPNWYSMPFSFTTGLYATLGGTCDVTFSYLQVP